MPIFGDVHDSAVENRKAGKASKSLGVKANNAPNKRWAEKRKSHSEVLGFIIQSQVLIKFPSNISAKLKFMSGQNLYPPELIWFGVFRSRLSACGFVSLFGLHVMCFRCCLLHCSVLFIINAHLFLALSSLASFSAAALSLSLCLSFYLTHLSRCSLSISHTRPVIRSRNHCRLIKTRSIDSNIRVSCRAGSAYAADAQWSQLRREMFVAAV